MAGKCPKCGNSVNVVNGDVVIIKCGGTSFKGVTYQCPMCQGVLGCQIDPIKLKQEIVQEVAALLQR